MEGTHGLRDGEPYDIGHDDVCAWQRWWRAPVGDIHRDCEMTDAMGSSLVT